MADVYENRTIRPVRLVGESLTLDGLLNVNLGGRTLDELNLGSRNFLTLSSPVLVSGAMEVGPGAILVSKAAVLLVLEVPEPGATLGAERQEPEMRRYGRASIRLRVGSFSVDGYVHVGPGGDALLRLNQATHPFLAVQSASVSGQGTVFSTPFLAVNRHHILSAQEMFSVNARPEEVAAGAGDATG
ncbi:MAG: DUF6812 domain-containing protein [Candidatus Polarisedimenticolia bacterium]